MRLLYLPFLTALIIFAGCKQDVGSNAVPTPVILHFNNTVGNQPLVLNTKYTNNGGEEFTLTKYKYYISNIALIDAGGKAINVPDSYFLIDQSNTNSYTSEMQAPGGLYHAVSFLIGVDSTRNVSGAQSGALDPANDMFWTWNTGYIMAKMEGTSPSSTIVNNKVEYHIGGFKGENNVVRNIVLPFSQPMILPAGRSLHIFMNADVLKWFNGTHTLSIATNPASTMPGSLANQFADNYSKMFTLASVTLQ